MNNQAVDVKPGGSIQIVIESSEEQTVNNPPPKKKTPIPSEKKQDEDASYTHLIPQEDYRTSPLFYEVANYFGVEQRGYDEAKEKLSMITEWAIMKTNSNKLEDVLPAIRKLENAIERPAWGETRYGNFYRYLRILSQKEKVDKVLDAYGKKAEN